MTLVATPARTGRWLDTDSRLNAEIALDLVNQGVQGVMRYVPLPGMPIGSDITSAELELLCSFDLQVLLVQHVRGVDKETVGKDGTVIPRMLWRPRDHDGAIDGRWASDYAESIGYPSGCTLFQDLEAIDGDLEETRVYCRQWSVPMAYHCGLYHGYAVPMSAIDLYQLPHTSYWTDAGKRPVAVRGNAIVQGARVKICEVLFDENILAPDGRMSVPFAATQMPMAA